MADIKAMFDKHDVNKDGTISSSELKAVVKEFGLPPCEHLVEQIIKDCDTNGNGTLELDEFNVVIQVLQQVKAAMADPATMEAEMKQMFQEFDKNGDGFLTKEEMQTALTKVHSINMTGDACEKILNVADKNKDGKLDYNEFVNMILQK
ncbi:TNNC2 [Branchiostoma lanceolatum]|uniref:TNNC2 protein n=1 Tax=Branchiostoma lanceolatum TaxID=7740 RepID=A0A8J9YZL8_BRALA|nr:TNNC2 [Branchiostoma lanceolatum]